MHSNEELARYLTLMAATRDLGALAKLINIMARRMTIVAGTHFPEPQEARSLVVDVFLKAWTNAHEYTERKGSVLSWMLDLMSLCVASKRKNIAEVYKTIGNHPAGSMSDASAAEDETVDVITRLLATSEPATATGNSAT